MKFRWQRFMDSEAALYAKATLLMFVMASTAVGVMAAAHRLFPDLYSAKGQAPWWAWYCAGAWTWPTLIKWGRRLGAWSWHKLIDRPGRG